MSRSKDTTPVKLYHFSCGNSGRGTIGFCASIRATTQREAVERLSGLLPDGIELDLPGVEAGEYVAVYFNADPIRPRHIDMIDEVEGQ